MKSDLLSKDVAIIGAGAAGSCCAFLLAQRGLSVVVLDAKPLTEAGASWHNAVPSWLFEASGIPQPQRPELIGSYPLSSLLLNRRARRTLFMSELPVCAIAMRRFITRMQNSASDLKATLIGGARVTDLEYQGGRVRALHAKLEDNPDYPSDLTVKAKLTVNASGLDSILTAMVPPLAAACPKVAPEDRCSAVQETRTITEREAAVELLQTLNLKPGMPIAYTSTNGGFSTEMLTIMPGFEEIELLTGVIADGRHGTGHTAMETLLQRHAFIGPCLRSGSALIPIRRPYSLIVAPGFALLGDAACQVFPAHASGVGVAMLAARLLTDAVASGDDQGSLQALWRYQSGFMRGYGSVCAAYDSFRRMVMELDTDELYQLFEYGLITANGSKMALLQHLPSVKLDDLPAFIISAIRAPKLVAKMAPTLIAMQRIRRCYTQYPPAPDPRAVFQWARTSAHLARVSPDLKEPPQFS